jgi:O-antigen ligase
VITLSGLEKAKKIFSSLFFFLLPTQLAYFFWPDWSYFWGIKVDFLSPSFFLTDAILLSLFLVLFLEFFLKESRPDWKKIFSWPILATIVFFLLNLSFSLLPPLSGYRLLKYWQLVFIISYFSKNFSFSLLIPLFFSLFLISLLAWGQFLTQGSIQGIFWLAGERFFNLSTLGIAKMNLFDRLFARPMATFSHPNSLAGFLLVALIIFWFFRRFLVKKLGGFFYLGLATMATVLVITFSGAVWLVIFLLALAYLIKKFTNRFLGLVLAGLLLGGFVFLSFRLGLLERASIGERFFLAQNAGRLFWKRPFLGWGLGSFIPAQGQLGLSRGSFNFYQPVHNLFLLILVEVGLLGFFCFFYWLVKWWLKVNYYWRCLFLVIAFLGFFDHYWLTLQQNFLLLGVVIAIALFASGVERGGRGLIEVTGRPHLEPD